MTQFGQSLQATNAQPLIGYCTNVHAGATLQQVEQQLREHALAVRRLLGGPEPLPVGLWLSASVARQLATGSTLNEFSVFLHDVGLLPYSANAFPFDDFHIEQVKYAVYQPDWTTRERLQYTLDMFRVLDGLLPAGQPGSISTLPLGWGRQHPPQWYAQCADHLLQCVRWLAEREEDTGRLIYLCLEPEPGCALTTSSDLVQFVTQHLRGGLAKQMLGEQAESLVARHLRVCHDVCHAAVMFETQSEVLDRYRENGLLLGKVQISSAIEARFPAGAVDVGSMQVGGDLLWEEQPPSGAVSGELLRRTLGALAEPRYLHQTVIKKAGDVPSEFFYDLPDALAKSGNDRGCTWRVHFHVPIFAQRVGALHTTTSEIVDFIKHWHASANAREGRPHWEVETYSWNVLPAAMRRRSLAEGIAQEISWLQQQTQQVLGSD